MPVSMSDEDFDRAVDDALDLVPDELIALIDNVVILVEDDPPDYDPDLLGLYDGVPLTERDTQYGLVAPDRVFLYRNPLKRMCDDPDDLREEIATTVVHEIGHYFGIDDDHLDDLGWG